MLVNRTEQHVIKKNNPVWRIIDEYSFKSKNLYNYANYLIRQEFINNGIWLRYMDVWKLCKNSEPYKDMGSNVGAATLRMLDKVWVSFFASIKDWKENHSKYLGRPKLPKYKDTVKGRYILGIDNIKFSIQNGYIRFSWKPLKPLNETFRTHIPNGSKLMQCRFVPRATDYVMEIVYQVEVPDIPTDSKNIISIDLGVENFVTMTNNIGLQPIVVKGGVLKSINQYFNKKFASISSELKSKNKQATSHRVHKLSEKRRRKLKYEMHLISKKIIEYCIENNIDTVVCGLNKLWKQNASMYKIANQKFTHIPHKLFLDMLAYKCENVGIRFLLTEESYTSGTSFLDGEFPCKENYDKSRRKYRGLFIAGDGTSINADVNGSYQIMRKAFPNAFANGIEGVGLHPLSMKIA